MARKVFNITFPYSNRIAKMKAIVRTKYGSPDVLELVDLPKPTPSDNEILIKVYASTVNRTDCGFLSATPFIVRFFSGLTAPKYISLGCEFSGVIEAIGSKVRTYKVGDKVFGFDDTKFSGHEEYLIKNDNDPISITPENIDIYEAAAIAEGSHYALCNVLAAKVSAGQNVLVNGGTGAIGSAAVQLCKYYGANVTAVTDTANIEKVKALGADIVIDYNKQDFTKMNHSFEFVFDAVGKSSFNKCRPIMKKQGIYISTELGYKGQNLFLAIITPLFGGKKLMFPLPSINKKDVDFLADLVAKGHFKPLIDRYYPLEQVAEAFRYVLTGQKIGNVVIKVG